MKQEKTYTVQDYHTINWRKFWQWRNAYKPKPKKPVLKVVQPK